MQEPLERISTPHPRKEAEHAIVPATMQEPIERISTPHLRKEVKHVITYNLSSPKDFHEMNNEQHHRMLHFCCRAYIHDEERRVVKVSMCLILSFTLLNVHLGLWHAGPSP